MRVFHFNRSEISRCTRRVGSIGLPISLAMCLTACAVPKAGPNAQASAPVATASAPPAPPASKPTIGQEVAAVANNKVEIIFQDGSATLTPDANKQLDLAARLYRDASPVAMFSTGYSDRSGDEFNNLLLSARRAEAVKRALVARGIPADRLLIQALGESDLADPSKPDAAINRRVTITWRLL
jgi:outer membrane protein OmpA-like peptidoglycan-associated protein